jgi:hypothetical protein
MKKFWIALLALCSMSAQASMLENNGPLHKTFSEAEDKDYYETLGQLYSKGTLPNLCRISHIAWAGRCFTKDMPKKPNAAGLIMKLKEDADLGPLGRSVNPYKVWTYWKQYGAPDFYDRMNIKQVFASGDGPHYSYSGSVEPSSDEIKIFGISGLRMSGSLLILDGSRSSNNVRCYYFIPALNDIPDLDL